MNDLFELTQEQKENAVLMIKRYFYEHREEELGDLGGLLFLDFICEKFGPYFYNLGIQDANRYMSEKLEDMFGLEK